MVEADVWMPRYRGHLAPPPSSLSPNNETTTPLLNVGAENNAGIGAETLPIGAESLGNGANLVATNIHSEKVRKKRGTAEV